MPELIRRVNPDTVLPSRVTYFPASCRGERKASQESYGVVQLPRVSAVAMVVTRKWSHRHGGSATCSQSGGPSIRMSGKRVGEETAQGYSRPHQG